ncbi:MAG: hypothetical protein NVV66_18255 [Cellulomonas sp.]|uniref:hypothetical protein n=1 Tax=Cellulomonas sp. TaxID=40001 RepID=UPI002588D6EB|nr:hypothetical protein [Cellulomonas sp.]MCR6706540.1 hypothetical protein [Cellulomonas sp.]
MSPDRHLPRWARVLGWWICVLTYVLAGVVALGDAFFPSGTIVGVVPDMQTSVSCWAMAAMSIAGLFGVVAHRWRVEWVAASVLAFLLLARSVPVWASVDDVPTRLAAAAMMTLGAFNLGRRALDMWVFYVNTTLVARHRLTLERRA